MLNNRFRMRIVAKPRFKIPMSQRQRWGRGDFCSRCPMLQECRDCAVTGRVLACESADELDVAGSRVRHG